MTDTSFPLVTSKVPSQEQADQFVKELAERSQISPELEKIIDSFRRSIDSLSKCTSLFDLQCCMQPSPCTL